MTRAAFVTRAIDEAGNAVGGSGTEVRIWDDFGATVASVVTDDAAGGTTITQPLVPNSGAQTSLTVTTGTGDTTLTVASTTGFAVGQLVPIYDGTNTRYRFIRAILSGPPRLTIESAIGVVFSNTNTSVGNPDMLGVIGGYVTDTSYHYIQTKDVASTRVMPPTLISSFIGIQSLAILEEGVSAGTRPTLNFIGASVTAVDNAPSTRVDVTISAPTQAAFDDHSARHEQGGADVVVPALHASRHDSGGADVMAIDAAVGTGSLRTLGVGATAAAAGNHGHLTLAAEQATTSGTSKDFTGIPSGVKRITVLLVGVSTNGTSPMMVQIGDSGGIETTGYTGTVISSGSADAFYGGTGFELSRTVVAAASYHARIELSLEDGSDNTWVVTGIFGAGTNTAFTGFTVGSKATSAVLDRVRLTTVNGTDAFDAGVVSILYE